MQAQLQTVRRAAAHQSGASELRTCLNGAIAKFIRENPGHLESIDAILDATAVVFAKYPNVETSQTALRHMCGILPNHDREVFGAARQLRLLVGQEHGRTIHYRTCGHSPGGEFLP